MAMIDMDLGRIHEAHVAAYLSALVGIDTAATSHDRKARRRTPSQALSALTERLAPGFRGPRNAAGGGGENTGRDEGRKRRRRNGGKK